jgi:hypothetical protein
VQAKEGEEVDFEAEEELRSVPDRVRDGLSRSLRSEDELFLDRSLL